MACNCRRGNRRQNTVTVRNLNQNIFIPSTIEIINSGNQIINQGEEIIFPETIYNTGISYSPRSDNFGVDIVATGVYKITFQGNVTVSENQTIGVAISLNGEPLPQSEILQYVTTAGPEAVTTTVISKVLSPSADIGVINAGENTFSVSNAKLDIVRIGNF